MNSPPILFADALLKQLNSRNSVDVELDVYDSLKKLTEENK